MTASRGLRQLPVMRPRVSAPPLDTTNSMDGRPKEHAVRRHPGFTLIEVIVAVSIIAILATMLVVGLQVVGASNKEKATRVTLQNAVNLLAEFERSAGTSRMGTGAVHAPDGPVTEGSPQRTAAAIRTTAQAFALLRSVPAVKSAMDQLPPEQLELVEYQTTPTSLSAPILLDAWNNPIIFVPPPYVGTDMNWDERYGLRNVDSETGETDLRVVNPGGINVSGRNLYPSKSASNIDRLRHFRPFFVSAGPDGDFRTHHDNIYSFEN